VLPITEEAEGDVRRIRLAPRLTPHVRHFAKYIDVPVPESRAFVFWQDGSPTGKRARTLREFTGLIENAPAGALDGHLRRSDFSRWVAEVFGDFPLARTIKQIEDDYKTGSVADVAAAFVQVVRSRYDFIAGPNHDR
jgi:hypothetical protein